MESISRGRGISVLPPLSIDRGVAPVNIHSLDRPHLGRRVLAVTRAGVEAVLARECAPGGRLADIGALVLECTLLPEFRRTIAQYTAAPILDIASFALSALGPGFDGDAASGPASGRD